MSVSSDVISIGSVAKYRGAYNANTMYYATNVVTMYCCVFQAISNTFVNIPPVKVNEDGTIALANVQAWRCLVDNTALYNATLSTNNLKAQIGNLDNLTTKAKSNLVAAIVELNTTLTVTETEWAALQSDPEAFAAFCQAHKGWDIDVIEDEYTPPTPPTEGSVINSTTGALSLDGVIASDGKLSLNATISSDGKLTL